MRRSERSGDADEAIPALTTSRVRAMLSAGRTNTAPSLKMSRISADKIKENKMDRQELLKRYNAGERNFAGVDLRGAYLIGANLSGIDLRRAILGGAYLRAANLKDAQLDEAYCNDTYFGDADLRGACLDFTSLYYAYLIGANLRGAYLGSPSSILLAEWGNLSPDLTLAATRYNAANHSKPFIRWTSRTHFNTVGFLVNFTEYDDDMFTLDYLLAAPPPSAYELMVALIREKCADSDYHDHKIELP